MNKYNGGPDTWSASPVPRLAERELTEEEKREDARRGFRCPTHFNDEEDWSCDCPFTPEAKARYGKISAGAVEQGNRPGPNPASLSYDFI